MTTYHNNNENIFKIFERVIPMENVTQMYYENVNYCKSGKENPLYAIDDLDYDQIINDNDQLIYIKNIKYYVNYDICDDYTCDQCQKQIECDQRYHKYTENTEVEDFDLCRDCYDKLIYSEKNKYFSNFRFGDCYNKLNRERTVMDCSTFYKIYFKNENGEDKVFCYHACCCLHDNRRLLGDDEKKNQELIDFLRKECIYNVDDQLSFKKINNDSQFPNTMSF